MAEGVQIRRAVPGDEAALALVGQATFLDAFAGILPGSDIVLHCQRQHAASIYRAWLDDPRSAVWLATVEPDEAPVGFLVLTRPDLPLAEITEADLEVKRIYLLARFKGQGVGRRLIDKAVEWAHALGRRRLYLGVYAKNSDALAFYSKTGFRVVGERTFHVGEHDYHDKVLVRDL